MSADLFMELAVEEIPAQTAPEIARALSEDFESELRELGVEFEKTVCFHTPRRFALMVKNLARTQKDRWVESFGPSESAAFDTGGSPTKAALGFAKSKGAKVEDLEIVEREKGRFLAFRQKSKGEKSERVFARIAPEIISRVRCGKSMRWQSGGAVFARPIRKISCFYDGRPLKLEIEGIPFSSAVSGHRFAGGKPFKPNGWSSYLKGLKRNFVTADPEERLKIIEKNANLEAGKLGGRLRRDHDLLQTVCGLVEHPVVLSGSFEKQFLNLPEEVLVSVMKNHQKYFPVFGEDGGLLPHFVFVCGTPVKEPQRVINGNRRVLRARFVDAEFFYSEDLKKPLGQRVRDLDSMVFLSGMGSYADKTARLEKTASELVLKTGKKRVLKTVQTAAKLSKADLATRMVFEIPELQGVMGRIYSAAAGEQKAVSAAIEQHHMPTARDSALPESEAGALLAAADRIDNICSCFYLGIRPSGSSDPFALRRQAIGLIQIALEKNLHFCLTEIVDFSIRLIEKAAYSKPPAAEIKTVSKEAVDFIAGRFRGIMVERGASPDSVEAAIAADFQNITDCEKRISAIENARKSASFAALASSFKRVVNILGNAAERKVSPELFENSGEKTLLQALGKVENLTKKCSYNEHLKLVATLGKPIDRFFDSTMIMHKNPLIRKNRTAMLGRIKDLFFKVGDLSKISTEK